MEVRHISEGELAVWHWRQMLQWPHPWDRKLPSRFAWVNRFWAWLERFVAE